MKKWYRLFIVVIGFYILVMYAASLTTYTYAWDTYENREPGWVDSLAAAKAVLEYPAILWFGTDTATLLMPLCNALIWSLGTCLAVYLVARFIRSRKQSS